MNRFLCLTAAFLVIAGNCGPMPAEEADSQQPAADVPQLAVLDRLRGEWTGTLESGDGTIKQTSRWILDGHVLESKFTFNTSELSGLILRTYDAEDKQYVMTYMDDSGSVLALTGQWDESQQALTLAGKNGSSSITFTTRFLGDGTTQWTIVDDGPAEETRISGTNHRVSK